MVLATPPFTSTFTGIANVPVTLPDTVNVAAPVVELNAPKEAVIPAGSGVPTAKLSPGSTGLTAITAVFDPLPANNCTALVEEPPGPETVAPTWVTASEIPPITGPMVPLVAAYSTPAEPGFAVAAAAKT